jgi:hypothetical protein
MADPYSATVPPNVFQGQVDPGDLIAAQHFFDSAAQNRRGHKSG